MKSFEETVEEALGELLRKDDGACRELWSALANVEWYHPESHSEASYSFRAAGGLIADVRGKGDYMDWYCSGPYATVSDRIARSMKKYGWIFSDVDDICDEPGCILSASCGTSTDDGYRHTCTKHMPKLRHKL